MLRSNRAQATAIVVGLLLVAVISVMATFLGTRDHGVDHNALRVVDYQRGLVQQIVSWVLLQPGDPRIDSAITDFEVNMRVLAGGGEGRALGGTLLLSEPLEEERFAASIEGISALWRSLKEVVLELRLLAVEDSARSALIADMQTNEPLLIFALADLAHLYEDHMESDLGSLRSWQLVAFASALPLVLAGLFTLRRRMMKPAEFLTAIGGVPAADWDGTTALYRDEVGDLVRSFERVRPELSDIQSALEERVLAQPRTLIQAFEYSQELVAQLELIPLLQLAVLRSQSLLVADSAAVCLLERGGVTLEIFGRQGHVTANVSVPERDDEVVRLQPLDSPDSDVCTRCTFARAHEDQVRLTVPMRTSGKTLGSLCVIRDEAARFKPDERQALQLLADSAAIAVTNVRMIEGSRLRDRESIIHAERAHLAAELHDNLAQTLGYLNLRADRMKQLLETSSPDVSDEIEEIKAASGQAYRQVRMTLDGLGQAQIQGSTGVEIELRSFVNDFRAMTGLEVEMQLDLQLFNGLSPLVQHQAFKIASEALTNIHRHAQAKQAQVCLASAAEGVLLTIRDDGRGFDGSQEQEGTHLGLAIMRTRAVRCGGYLKVESSPGLGTTVLAFLPYRTGESFSED